MSTDFAVEKILILAANPKDLPPLRLEQEVRDIEEGLERSQKREQFIIVKKSAVRPRDFRRALMDVKPQIVHFCGHGLTQEGIALENEIGKIQLVSAKALAGLFQLFSQYVKCVVLNACFSQEQAKAISQHINYVVGMSQAIGDRAAIEFAVAFYDALATEDHALKNPASVEFAYKLGCTAIDMAGISSEALTPVLLKKPSQSVSVSNSESTFSNQKSTRVEENSPVLYQRAHHSSRLFISYQEPNIGLANAFCDILMQVGHQVFISGDNTHIEVNWAQQISNELEQCDYLLLFLSPQSAVSEIVLEKIRQARKLQEHRTKHKPIILSIRINFPVNLPLNYELRGYLSQLKQWEWLSSDDTPRIAQEIINILAGKEKLTLTKMPEISAFQGDNNPDIPPLPVAEPELQREPGGTVPLDSGLYVDRLPIEEDCYREISQPGALIRIKAPRQMGKTSLMARILNYASAKGYKVISLSFQRADGNAFEDLNQLLRWFSEQVGRRLKRLNQLDTYWSKGGVKDRCHFYFEECLLEEIDTPLVLAIDEVDRVFPYRKVADDFFALLRSWFEAARIGDYSSETWQKFRLVIVHSTEVYVPLDINQSPFNVGKNVELLEFNLAQVQDLTYRYGLQWEKEQVNKLMKLIGGHPYLVRKALYHIRRQDITLDQLVQAAPTEAGIYSDHLRRHLLNLQQYPQLAKTLRQVVLKSKPVEIESDSAFKLDSMGLIKLQGNDAVPRCDLYRQYFGVHLKA
ncbi:MAG: TIR domain-containing protein [Leptolyngbya sp. SIO3F4]|nr:TIR domain-containing protein [Leptolyngbya sp. SIO3F4]